MSEKTDIRLYFKRKEGSPVVMTAVSWSKQGVGDSENFFLKDVEQSFKEKLIF